MYKVKRFYETEIDIDMNNVSCYDVLFLLNCTKWDDSLVKIHGFYKEAGYDKA